MWSIYHKPPKNCCKKTLKSWHPPESYYYIFRAPCAGLVNPRRDRLSLLAGGCSYTSTNRRPLIYVYKGDVWGGLWVVFYTLSQLFCRGKNIADKNLIWCRRWLLRRSEAAPAKWYLYEWLPQTASSFFRPGQISWKNWIVVRNYDSEKRLITQRIYKAL